jgi:hypothetical protein
MNLVLLHSLKNMIHALNYARGPAFFHLLQRFRFQLAAKSPKHPPMVSHAATTNNCGFIIHRTRICRLQLGYVVYQHVSENSIG